MLVASVAFAACERAKPFDFAAEASRILAECGDDSACVRERWHREPRDWNLGLRAEVAGRGPEAMLVVETNREIVTPELRGSPCVAEIGGAAGLYYRTWVAGRRSAEFPLALFHWKSFDDAIAGHRRVVAVIADARGEASRVRAALRDDPALDRACVRLRGERDRCSVS